MSLQQSNLAAQGLGYDMIVAMSQTGLTETMGDKYDSLTGKPVSMYWTWNNVGKGFPPDPSTYADLKLPNNLDPFTVPAWQTSNGANAHITALQTARFTMAAKGTPGMPDSVSYPEILTLNSDGTADLTIYFLDLRVVWAVYDDAGNITQYLSVSQDDETPLTIVFRLPFKTIFSDSNLPPAVQKALGSSTDINVQQLVLDFGSAYHTGLNIPGLDQVSTLPGALNNTFGSLCLNELADAGVTTVSYAASPKTLLPATLPVTSLAGRGDMLVDANGRIITNPTSDQLSLSMLNLYCATNGDPLPASVQLPWNWLDTPQEGAAYDGAMAFKYSTIVNYFKSKMDTYVAGNSYLPVVAFDENHLFFYPTLNGGQTPQIAEAYTTFTPENSGMILNYYYHSPVVANDYGDGRSMSMYSTFNLNVSITQETIVVNQLLVIHAEINFGGGPIIMDVVNTTVLDTYTIKVDAKGYLLLDVNTVTKDNSNLGSIDYDLIPDYFQGVPQDLAAYADGVVKGGFDVDPLNQIQQFVFPGGRTFMFSDAKFSDHGDLVAHISFVEDAN